MVSFDHSSYQPDPLGFAAFNAALMPPLTPTEARRPAERLRQRPVSLRTKGTIQLEPYIICHIILYRIMLLCFYRTVYENYITLHYNILYHIISYHTISYHTIFYLIVR